MNRAQKIIERRRQEMLQEKLKEEREEAEFQKKFNENVEKTYEWILDLFENPTPFNTPYEVYLSNNIYGKIQIGYGYKEEETDKYFDDDVMKEVGKRLKNDGFKVSYHSGTFPESFSSLQVEIK